jgi:hypothetical protein
VARWGGPGVLCLEDVRPAEGRTRAGRGRPDSCLRLVRPGLGELLLALAPPPQQVGFGPLSSGSIAFALPVPDQSALVGVGIAFQGAALAFDPGQPVELSNGLRVTITQ